LGDNPAMTSLRNALAATIWGRALDPGQLARVTADTLERSVPGGGYIFRKGEPVEHWIGVLEGLAKMSIVSPEGRVSTFTGIPPGAWFGEGSVLRGGAWRYDVIALRETRVAMMPGATFNWLLDSSFAFNRFLLGQLNERLAQFIALLESERLFEPDARVARCLAWLFNPYLYPGVGQRLQISQEEIGYLSGVSRQRVNQALQVLEKAGLLRVEYGAVTVLELDKLGSYGN
jgi:CRP/FNR family cyclic AMP-dependent transcriptional regulator